MDKQDFKDKLRAFLSNGKVGVASQFPADEDNIAVVTAVEDFDPKSNDMWDIPANKSHPRDLHCYKCSRQIVMSDGMFKMYQEADPKPKVICGSCLLGIK